METRRVGKGFRAEGPAHPLPVPLGTGLADQWKLKARRVDTRFDVSTLRGLSLDRQLHRGLSATAKDVSAFQA